MNTILEHLTDQGYYPTGAPDSISGFLSAALNIILGVGFALALINFAWAFILYILSKGDPKGTQQAWNAIVYGLYAVLVCFITIVMRVIALNVIGVTSPALLTPANF